MKKLIIAIIVLLNSGLLFAQAPNWTVNPSNYQNTMNITSVAWIYSIESTDVNDMVATFVNGECRGVSNISYIASINRYFAFLTVYSNLAQGDTLWYSIYDASADTVYEANQYEVFTADNFIGSPTNPIIVAYPSLNTASNLLSFSFTEETAPAIFDTINKIVDIEVVNTADLTNLITNFTVSAQAKTYINDSLQQNGITGNDFSNPVDFTVVSEDMQDTSVWVINTTKAIALNNESNIITYAFAEETAPAIIDSSVKLINISVGITADVNNLTANFSMSLGAKSYVNNVLQTTSSTINNFADTVFYTVIAENLTDSSVWSVVINQAVALNSTAEVLAFSFLQQTAPATIDTTNKTIDIEVVSSADLTNLTPEFTLSYGAKATINGAIQTSGIIASNYTDTVVFTVIAENLTDSTIWKIITTKATNFNNETDILTFSFAEETGAATINNGTKTITIEVNETATITNLVANFTISSGATAKIGNTIQQSGITSNDFATTVNYTVIAENLTDSSVWSIAVTQVATLNDSTDFLSFSLAEQTAPAIINTTNHLIEIEVENNINVAQLIPNFTLSTGATAKISETTQQSGSTVVNFNNIVVYDILAEDGVTTEQWYVSVSEEQPTAIVEYQENKLAIYPNPATNFVTIELDALSNSNVQVINALGAIVLSRKGVFNQLKITVNNWEKGIYFIVVSTEKNRVVKQLIVE